MGSNPEPAVHVRYYAGMVDRVGLETETYLDASTLGSLAEMIVARHGQDVAEALRACSFLVGGVPLRGAEEVLTPSEDGEIRVEILPPFAGG